MIYLLEHKVGFHATGIGFPSISGCHAIVAQTANGLFGYHSYGGSTATAYQPRSRAFAGFVTGHAQTGPCAGLYSAAFRTMRYGSAQTKVDWRQEIQEYARALGYTGKIRGLDLTGLVPRAGDVDPSAYVQFDLVGGSVNVSYKRWDKMQPGAAVAVAGADYKQLTPKGVNTAIENTTHGMHATAVITTASNKGLIHKVGKSSLDNFTPS
ncbi:MAG: hypothetical protein ACT4P7_15760 [Gemmatimonadaceae bacterium]